MIFDDQLAVLTEMSRLVDLMSKSDEPMSPEDRIDLWVVATGVLDELRTHVRQLESDATLALVDLDVRPEHALTRPFGTVKRSKRRRGSDKWAGWSMCDALADDLVDASSGEIVRAVRVEIMRDAVPGCADDALTSSRWRLTGLRGRIDVDRYHLERPVTEDGIELIS